jgi:hypothetical protein
MKKLHFAAVLCALSAPALAQTGQSSGPPAPQSSSMSAPPTDTAPPPAAAPSPSVADVVTADFPKYDKDKSGELSKAEFSTWISEAKAQGGGTAPDKKALGEAFMKADSDKNKTVSASELTSFLS